MQNCFFLDQFRRHTEDQSYIVCSGSLMEKHSCRICGRSFPSGRSLGGHMRSHVMQNSPMMDEERPSSKYGLRDNPKKSRRFGDAWPGKEKDEVRAKSAKPSSLLNSFFGMSRDELNREENDDLWSRGSYEEEAEETPSHSYSEVTIISMPVRKQRRSGAQKAAKISVYSSPPAALSLEYEEEKNGALCLLMLSRGTYSLSDLSDEISPIIGFRNKVHSFPSDDEDQRFKKPKVSPLISSGEHGDIRSAVIKCGKRSLSKHCYSESGMHSSYKRSRYNKSFHSYQALGGHCTSHSKTKGHYKESIAQNCGSQTVGKSSEKFRSHACTICGKKFPSGQALGGHKRSHLVAASAVVVSTGGSNGVHPNPALMEIEQKVSKLNSIDLNLSAPVNGCLGNFHLSL